METRWIMSNKFWSTILTISAASIFALFGCSFAGKRIPLEKRIPLVSDCVQRGELVIEDFKLSYTYILHKKNYINGGLLEVEGNAQWNYVAYSLNLFIYFLNSEGKILERKVLRSQNINVSEMRFQERLEPPAGTVSISFDAILMRLPIL